MLRRLKAFSLIEIAIVLIIVGIISSLMMPTLTASLEAARLSKTENHKERLFYVLASYVLHHGRLPCPSSFDRNLGIAPETCQKHFIGLIPFKTLGISEELAKDGFGQWFTYAVNPALTSQHLRPLHDPLAEATYCTIKHSPLILFASLEDRTPVFVDSGEDHLAVLLISSAANNGIVESAGGEAIFFLKGAVDLNHRLFWVSRNNLLALYARTHCPVRKTGIVKPHSVEKGKLW